MKQSTILLVEDEKDIRDLISFQLTADGHKVLSLENTQRALEILEDQTMVDLFMIDWMLPGPISGLELIKVLRSQKRFSQVPIVMITALTQPENIVTALDAGADDYITKPFDLAVLQARVRVQLRSSPLELSGKIEVLNFGKLRIELNKCKVLIDEEEIQLTSTEYKILCLLSKKPGHVFTRDQFINNIQGENIFVSGRTIDTHVAGLRKKMGSCANMIETIRGIGYKIKEN
jgi:DNA-binding response OmpR family regulator